MKTNSSSNNDFRDAFPVIRFDYNKRLLDSNLTALPLLGDWKCRQGSKIPSAIWSAYPELEQALSDQSPSGCKVSFGELQIWFDVVPFPEAGYIGMYGYHIESMVPESMPQKLRMTA